MSDKWEKFLHYVMEDDSELMELEHIDPEIILEEINNDPELRDVKAPDDLYDKVFAQIREYEEQKRLAALTDEDRELIRLGKIHRKRLSRRKYVVLAAALVAVFAIGTVSMGNDKNFLTYLKQMVLGGEQTVSDKGSTEPIQFVDEEEVYEEIEDKYNFVPIKLRYLPQRTTFSEAVFCTDVQEIYLYYGIDDRASIIYTIKPNYRETSYSTIVEDEKVQEYTMIVGDVEIVLKEYKIIDANSNRWLVSWTFNDVQYILNLTNIEKSEVELIVKNLKFNE